VLVGFQNSSSKRKKAGSILDPTFSASSGLPDRLAYLAKDPFKRFGCLPIV